MCIGIILILKNYTVIYNVLLLLNEKGNPLSEFKILRSSRINNQPVAVPRPIGANPNLNFNLGFFVSLFKRLFGLIFYIL